MPNTLEQLQEENKILQSKILLLSNLTSNVDQKILDIAKENAWLKYYIELGEREAEKHCMNLGIQSSSTKLFKRPWPKIAHMKREHSGNI